jgi:hypothetical protein
LRHQVAVYKRTVGRPRLRTADRLLWVGLTKVWVGWRHSLVFVTPETVLRWQRRRFREHWAKLSARPGLGRPPVNAEIIALVRRMTAANPLWGAPRIHGELLKLGMNVAERTVSRLIAKRRPPPSQTWRAFLTNHLQDLVSIDFLTVPTAKLRVLFVLVVLAHHRRRVLHFNVTEHPTAAWTAQQIVDTFPDDTAPVISSAIAIPSLGTPFADASRARGSKRSSRPPAARGKPLPGAPHRLDAARVPRPCRHPERASPAPPPDSLLRVSPQHSN